MAIGLMRMFGFRILENFNYPYISRSIREFWRRWHISLSNWFRDYLYIPLGGNQRGERRAYANLVHRVPAVRPVARRELAVRAVGHLARPVPRRRARGPRRRAAQRLGPLAHAYALLAVMGGWVLFRCETLTQAMSYYAALLGRAAGDPARHPLPEFLDPFVAFTLVVGIVFATPLARAHRTVARPPRRMPAGARPRRRVARRRVPARERVPRGGHLQSVHLLPVLMADIPAPSAADHPRRDRIVALLFAIAIAWPAFALFSTWSRTLTRFENRPMAPWPAPALSREFPPAFDRAFSDRFGGRDALVRFHHGALLRLFGVSSLSHRDGRQGRLVLLARRGRPLARPPLSRRRWTFRRATWTARSPNSSGASEWLAARGIAYVVVVVPDKFTIYPEHLPVVGGALGRSRRRTTACATALARDGRVAFVDLRARARRREGARARVLPDRLALELQRRDRRVRGAHARRAAQARRQAARTSCPPSGPPYTPGVDFYSGDLLQMLGMPSRVREDDVAPLGKVFADDATAARGASTRTSSRASSSTSATSPACRARSCCATRWRSR